MNTMENSKLTRSERIGRIVMVWGAVGLFLLGLLLLLVPLRTHAQAQPFPSPGKAADNGGAISGSISLAVYPCSRGGAMHG